MKELKNLLIIIIVASFFTKLNSQISEQSLLFADSMYNDNKIDLALKEYLKIFYLDKENKYSRICENISNCFIKRNDITNAIKYQDIFYFKLKFNDARRNEIRYTKQMFYLISEEYNKALVEILQVNKNLNFDHNRHQFLLALNFLMSNQFEKAKYELTKLSYYSTLDTMQLNQAFNKLIKNNKKNPKNARLLSVIVPGLGQVVNGEIKDGLNSFGLFVGFTAIWIELSKSIGIGDASLSVAPWIIRYYLGGLNNSIEAAQKNKHNNKQSQIETLISIIEKGKIN